MFSIEAGVNRLEAGEAPQGVDVGEINNIVIGQGILTMPLAAFQKLWHVNYTALVLPDFPVWVSAREEHISVAQHPPANARSPGRVHADSIAANRNVRLDRLGAHGNEGVEVIQFSRRHSEPGLAQKGCKIVHCSAPA